MVALLLPLLLLLDASSRVVALDMKDCDKALGMESGAIRAEDIAASSSFDEDSVGTSSARIRTDVAGGAWCPRRQIDKDTNEYIEINLGTVHILSAVETQGRYGGGQGKEFPTQYMLDYWRPGSTGWTRYKNRRNDKLLTGNTDTSTPVMRPLDPPIVAARLRFVPFSIYPRTMCMRVEVYGCAHTEGVLSYRVAQGERLSNDVRLEDDSYDGDVDGGVLRGGLGQLTDGHIGGAQSPFGALADAHVSPSRRPEFAWVGWRNRSVGSALTMTFAFDAIREFGQVRLHVAGEPKSRVGSLASALVFSALREDSFDASPVVSFVSPATTSSLAGPHWAVIGLNRTIAKFLQLRIKFADDWFLVSEVEFDSEISTAPLPMDVSAKISDYGHNSDVFVEEGGMDVAPVDGIPRPYVLLAAGVMVACFVLCTILLLSILLCNKRRRKLCGSLSPAYSGLKQAPPGEAAALTLKANHQLALVSGADGLHAVAVVSARCPPNGYSQGTLVQGADGQLFVADAGTLRARPGTAAELSPRFKAFHFPPPPPPDYTDSSEYAEPTELSRSAATLPLLTTPAATVDRRRAVGAKPTPPPRAFSSHSSVAAGRVVSRPTLHKSPSKSAQTQANQPLPSRESPILHYASSDVTRQSDGTQTLDDNRRGQLPKSSSLVEIPRQLIRFRQSLGRGAFGEIQLGEVTGPTRGVTLPADCQYDCHRPVAVKLLNADAADNIKNDFYDEIDILSRLHDANIVQLLGVCMREQPICMVLEYATNGDLVQFLRHRHALPHGALIYMGTQVASGMKYLESLSFVHRDLAARNCLVDERLAVKVGDFAVALAAHQHDYALVDGDCALPIRWMASECIRLNKFSSKSDVWAFAVTLWEILTLARERPLAALSDADVLHNAELIAAQDPAARYLERPANCPKELYDLLHECWQATESLRPSFREIHLFLQRKNLGFDPMKFE